MGKAPTVMGIISDSIARHRLKSFSVGNDGLRIELRGSANENIIYYAPTDAVAFRALVSSAILAHSSGERISIKYQSFSSILGQIQTRTILAIGFGKDPEF